MKYSSFCLIFIAIIYLFLFKTDLVNAASCTAEDLRRLKKGEIVVKSVEDALAKGGLEAVEAKVLIHASPEKVWNLLDNQEELDKIIPKIKKIQVLEKETSYQKVKVNLATVSLLPVFEYTVLLDQKDKYKEIKFNRIEGSFKELYGAWRIEPYNEDTMLTYIIYIDLGFYLPDFLREFGLNKMLPETLKAIKVEAEKNNKLQ